MSKFDKRYLEMAQIWAKNSYCKRRQVGALIVKDRMIISDGYNGTPSGFENVCEDENGVTKPYVLHAEANAISKVAKSGNSSQDATLYVTASPCMECAKLIIQAGMKRVVYLDEYRLTDGIDLLKRAGIECLHYIEDEEEQRHYMDSPAGHSGRGSFSEPGISYPAEAGSLQDGVFRVEKTESYLTADRSELCG